MELKEIVLELQDLESGLCFLTEEHLQAISAAIGVLERVDVDKIYGIILDTHERIKAGKGGPIELFHTPRRELAHAITDYLEEASK